jgi:GDP-D-mannose dehydratase
VNRQIATITSVTGQDDAYLAEFLLHKGYTALVAEPRRFGAPD